MTYLPDVNVWIALYAELSAHHEAACQWFEGIGEADVVFCRLTQLGFLRLLTNRHVMQEEVLSPAAAWEAYQSIRQNPKVGFAVELAGFPEVWRAPGATLASSPNLWTDALPGSIRAGELIHAGDLRPETSDANGSPRHGSGRRLSVLSAGD